MDSTTTTPVAAMDRDENPCYEVVGEQIVAQAPMGAYASERYALPCLPGVWRCDSLLRSLVLSVDSR